MRQRFRRLTLDPPTRYSQVNQCDSDRLSHSLRNGEPAGRTIYQLERGYTPRKAYPQSKLANAVDGIELDRRPREPTRGTRPRTFTPPARPACQFS
jgi:hypothetical protein